MATVYPERETNRREIWRQYRDFYAISSGLTLVVIGVWIGSLIFSDGYGTNLYTEGMGVLVTILVLDRINQWRDRNATQKRLIREAGSRSNELAIASVEWLRAENWLSGDKGLLRNAHLWAANLSNSNLTDANLNGTYLRDAILSGADLRNASLKDATLRQVDLSDAQAGDADFERANLHNSNLSKAVLLRANLKDARLTYVNLSGANLRHAQLSGADFTGAIFDEQTVLPDANPTGRDNDGNLIFDNYWRSDTDMTRYTDPAHPDFWQPE